MSNEEFERMMEFILGQQAQFNANVQKHDERLARNEEIVGQLGQRLDQLRDHVVQIENLVNRLAAATLAGFKDANAKIDALVDSQIRLAETQDRLADSHARLADAQTRTEETQNRLSASLAQLAEAQARTEANQGRTDEALRNLIATVDRHISGGRNGGQK